MYLKYTKPDGRPLFIHQSDTPTLIDQIDESRCIVKFKMSGEVDVLTNAETLNEVYSEVTTNPKVEAIFTKRIHDSVRVGKLGLLESFSNVYLTSSAFNCWKVHSGCLLHSFSTVLTKTYPTIAIDYADEDGEREICAYLRYFGNAGLSKTVESGSSRTKFDGYEISVDAHDKSVLTAKVQSGANVIPPSKAMMKLAENFEFKLRQSLINPYSSLTAAEKNLIKLIRGE